MQNSAKIYSYENDRVTSTKILVEVNSDETGTTLPLVKVLEIALEFLNSSTDEKTNLPPGKYSIEVTTFVTKED